MTVREKLVSEAEKLGIEFHHATGDVKLQGLIDDANTAAGNKTEPVKPVELTRAQILSSLKKEQTKLVRVVVRCNNDAKKDWRGELFKVSNSIIGTITRFVPFDNENGWHIEQAILNTINDKVCQKHRKGKLPNGMPTSTSFTTKEFTVEKMAPLTKKELEELASEQDARGSID